MSGRKYSEVELANSVRETIACRLMAEQTATRAESLVDALHRACKTTPSLRPSADDIEQVLGRIREQLSSIRRDESRMMRLDLADVRTRRQGVQALNLEIEEITRRCREGNQAAGTRAELAAMLDHLERTRLELEPWLRDVYQDFVDRTKRLLAVADDEIRQTGKAASSAAALAGHAAELEATRSKVSARRTQDAERRYIALALQRVCAELGFTAVLAPQNGPLDDLVVKVDTFAYGILHFRLQLDGTIRSESELAETTCCANFGFIEDKLKSLGVISAFRYEDTQLPVRLEKGSKEVPAGELQAAALRTQSND